MLQLTSLTQKISLLLVLSLLSTLMPGPAAISGTAPTPPTEPAAFTSPLPTPTLQPQVATFTSPLPTPPAPAPSLGLTVRAEPVGVAPGETVTLTVTLNNPTETALTGVSIHAVLPGALQRIPHQPGWAYDAPQKRLRAEMGTLTAEAGVTLTLTLRAAGPVDTFAPVTFAAVSGEMRATATAEVWIVQPGRARVTPEVGGLLVSPDRGAWVRFPAGAVDSPKEVTFEEVDDLPAFLPYGLGRAFAVRGLAPSAVGVRFSRKELPADSVSWQLATLFQYSETEGRWERRETAHRWEGEDLVLMAQVGEPGLFAVALSTQSDLGDYAQPWQPTVRDYQVDLFTGAATWRIPIEVPVGRGGLAPQLALVYNSGIVDALRGSENPQTPGVGMGWMLETAYIEREIRRNGAGTPEVYLDGRDTFRLVLNGVSSKLVCIDSSVTPCVEYRTEEERYWRVRKLTGAPNESQYSGQSALKGEYWVVTTPDGTTYRFGWSGDPGRYNQPYNEGEQSAWYMYGTEVPGGAIVPYIWRWNLDRIEDRHGNVISFFYAREYNDYNVCNGNNPRTNCWYGVDGLNDPVALPAFYAYTPDGRLWQVTNSGLNGWPYGYVRGGHLAWVSYTRGGGGSEPYNVSISTREEAAPLTIRRRSTVTGGHKGGGCSRYKPFGASG